QHRADHGHTIVGLEHGWGISEHHRDGIVLADATGGKCPSKPARALIEFGIGIAPLAVNNRGVLGKRVCRALEKDERRQWLVVRGSLTEIGIVWPRHGPALGAFP